MATKIKADIDIKIIEALASGLPNKEIADMYGVSPSYISKIKTGKKIPYIHMVNPTLIRDEFFEVYNTPLSEVLGYLNAKDLLVDKNSIVEYIEIQMKKAIIQAKMYQEILKRINNTNLEDNK